MQGVCIDLKPMLAANLSDHHTPNKAVKWSRIIVGIKSCLDRCNQLT